jgi:hypothetical protein
VAERCVQRSDDTLDALKTRLVKFNASTATGAQAVLTRRCMPRT